MFKEKVTVKNFREGSNLGLIRLKKLAKKNSITVIIGGKEFKPVGFDTYGHPIISEENDTYFRALKANKERNGEIFYAEVSYEEEAFCIKPELYNSIEAIDTALEKDFENEEKGIYGLQNLKNVLINRKKAHFCGQELNSFILYNKYVLSENGKVYFLDGNEPIEIVRFVSEQDFNLVIKSKEIHIPGPEDVCALCGKKFSLKDLFNGEISENNSARKVHCYCAERLKQATDQNLASKIIDAVYPNTPKLEIIEQFDEIKNVKKIWYLYHTEQGDISLRMKRQVIEIIWYENFRPFNIYKLFDGQEIKVYSDNDRKIAHPWTKDDAIKCLIMAKRL